MRRQFSPEQKAKVVLAALRSDQTVNQIASASEVNPTQVKQWRDAVKDIAPTAFTDKRKAGTKTADMQKTIDELHRLIGVRDAELEWLKKKIHGIGL